MLVLTVWGCKTPRTTTAVSTSKYYEDLSVHRPELDETSAIQKKKKYSSRIAKPERHVKAELDTALTILAMKNARPRTRQGYTVQLYRGVNRDEATRILGKFRIRFPNKESEIVYFQPDFKVNAGKFVSRIEAYEFYGKVTQIFPNALMIPHKIKLNHD